MESDSNETEMNRMNSIQCNFNFSNLTQPKIVCKNSEKFHCLMGFFPETLFSMPNLIVLYRDREREYIIIWHCLSNGSRNDCSRKFINHCILNLFFLLQSKYKTMKQRDTGNVKIKRKTENKQKPLSFFKSLMGFFLLFSVCFVWH